MPRHRSYYPRDEAPVQDGDRMFLGVNMRLDPGTLPAGIGAFGMNRRFRDGSSAPRKGIRKLSWTSIDPADPGDVMPLGRAHGAGMFKDPVTDRKWIIIVAGGGAYRMAECQGAVPLTLPEGVSLTEHVRFTQCMSHLIMFRGEDDEGLILRNVNEGFRPVSESPYVTGDGTSQMPNAATGLYFQNRLWVPDGDLVVFSDYLDYTRTDEVTQSIAVERGDGDKTVALEAFNESTILVFKERSVHVIGGLVPATSNSGVIGGGIYSDAFVNRISTEWGLKAPGAVAVVGKDVWFLADQRGVVSIRQTEQNKLQGVEIPISEPIAPLIDRIDWEHAQGACMAVWDNKVYVAVPMDSPRENGDAAYAGSGQVYDIVGALDITGLTVGRRYKWVQGNGAALVNDEQVLTESDEFLARDVFVTVTGEIGVEATFTLYEVAQGINNAVLVYDLITQQWAGYDYGDAVSVVEFVKIQYGGQARLAFVDSQGYLNLYEDGHYDHIGNPTDYSITLESVASKFVSRGYLGANPGRKRFERVDVDLATWWPTFTLGFQRDGVKEIETVGEFSKDRLVYNRPFTAAPYDASNTNDDWATPGREDYSVAIATGATLDLGANGVLLNQHQEWNRSYRLQGSGRFVQVVVEGSRGRCEVRRIEVNGQSGERSFGGRI